MTEIDNIRQQKDLAKKILQEYAKLEENEIKDTPYAYYCYSNVDSYTDFQGLSNSNKIIVKSKINAKYMPIIMNIFQDIYENNYRQLAKIDDEEDIGFIYSSQEENINITNEELKRLNNYDFDEWINLLYKYSETFEYESPPYEDFILIEEVRIYKKIPDIEIKYYRGSKEPQKVYKLLDIANLIV